MQPRITALQMFAAPASRGPEANISDSCNLHLSWGSKAHSITQQRYSLCRTSLQHIVLLLCPLFLLPYPVHRDETNHTKTQSALHTLGPLLVTQLLPSKNINLHTPSSSAPGSIACNSLDCFTAISGNRCMIAPPPLAAPGMLQDHYWLGTAIHHPHTQLALCQASILQHWIQFASSLPN